RVGEAYAALHGRDDQPRTARRLPRDVSQPVDLPGRRNRPFSSRGRGFLIASDDHAAIGGHKSGVKIERTGQWLTGASGLGEEICRLLFDFAKLANGFVDRAALTP